jgi:hypothetical protein
MNQQKSLIRIAELLSRFKIEVNILNANAQLDINIVAEDILIPILNIVYDCNLQNAKYCENDTKFPALDLLDRKKRIGFQITSTSTIKKVRHTIEGIVKNNFYSLFDTFYIYIITQKQNIYDKTVLKETTQGLFNFTEKNITDESDLYLKIASLNFKEIQRVEKLLEIQFSDNVKKEAEIQEGLRQIILQAKTKYNELALGTEMEGACKARQGWLEKKLFFENKLPSISDTNQQFSLSTQLAEINEKIESYNNQISTILTQISECNEG